MHNDNLATIHSGWNVHIQLYRWLLYHVEFATEEAWAD